jgi:hypothetical protein
MWYAPQEMKLRDMGLVLLYPARWTCTDHVLLVGACRRLDQTLSVSLYQSLTVVCLGFISSGSDLDLTSIISGLC